MGLMTDLEALKMAKMRWRRVACSSRVIGSQHEGAGNRKYLGGGHGDPPHLTSWWRFAVARLHSRVVPASDGRRPCRHLNS